MSRQNKTNTSKLYILPIAIMFGILTFSSGQASSYGGANANLFLQPTVPTFPSANVGSFFFAAAPVRVVPTYLDQPSNAFLHIDYRSRLPTAPTFIARKQPIIFSTYAIATPIQPIYFTPTRALFDVRYTYDNFAQVLDP
ncbi:MAG: hypothetical protein HY517_02570 [Candidatus Aenigmarchaeota archaeon]|nr:hypothetical protein [Candidatus Aenigmarchaeota archaeon]